MTEERRPETRLATHSDDELYYRDAPLVGELLGNVTFTEAMFAHILGRPPAPGQVKILDAVLVALMEHGLTPSAISSRLTYHSAPEALQSAVAAGLLNVGSQFVGTMENSALLLRRLVDGNEDFEIAARREIEDYRSRKEPLPGFGHHLHKPDDPRSPRLFAIARAEAGVTGTYIDALERFSVVVDTVLGKHLTINATGAVAAVLMEIDVAPEIMRGFAVISRAAGLVAHIHEEQLNPTARTIWDTVENAVPYAGSAPVGKTSKP